ncbi:MAG: HAD-IA family hydrolase [Candidatus Aenigmarchaeota archaeon]|nr:HAD-IA family hydrolase [Candidatus Aenigmarchaeota archaeon]
MSMKIKAIVFDCGGVLLSNSWNDPSYDIIPKKLGISKDKADEIFYKHWHEIKIGKKNEDSFFKDLLKISRKRISLNELKKIYYSCIDKFDGTFEIIKKLHKKYLLFILNNEGKEWMDFRIKKFKLKKYFKGFICSGFARFAKPDKRIYEILLEETGLKPNECIFIDNIEENLKPAKYLGYNVILFKNAKQLKDALSKYGIDIK